jgi:hypothetical protein
MADRESIFGPVWRAFRAAVAFLGHLMLVLLLVFSIWALEQLVVWLWGQREPMLYGIIPLKWLFNTMDAAIFLVFTVWGAIEAHRKLKG